MYFLPFGKPYNAYCSAISCLANRLRYNMSLTLEFLFISFAPLIPILLFISISSFSYFIASLISIFFISSIFFDLFFIKQSFILL